MFPVQQKIFYPYSSFHSFEEAIETLGQKQLDKFSAKDLLPLVPSYAHHIISNLRFFGFANENSEPTELFKKYVSEKSKRPEIMKELIKKSYPEVFSKVTSSNEITNSLLNEVFSKNDPSEPTKRKVVAFFKNACNFAKIPLAKTTIIRTPILSKTSPQENKMLDEPQKERSDVKTINLKSGGSLALSVDVNILALSQKDRVFLFDLIDKLSEYEQGGEANGNGNS